MSYFLYEKSEIKDIEALKKAQYKSQFNAIRIVVENSNKKLSYSFKQFMKKYFSIVEYGEVHSSSEKVDAFKRFINRHQSSSGNRFGIVSSNGDLFEPLDFIKFLEDYNIRIDLNKTDVKRRLNPMQVK